MNLLSVILAQYVPIKLSYISIQFVFHVPTNCIIVRKGLDVLIILTLLYGNCFHSGTYFYGFYSSPFSPLSTYTPENFYPVDNDD